MVWRLLAAAIGGFAAHQLHKPTQRFGPRWGAMLRYGVGSLALIPFRLMVLSKMREVARGRRAEDDILISDLVTLGAFGTGVFVGYLLDDMQDV